jgi:short-subunit dehydrogenase
MARSLADQVALVTGASSGIGWELAKQLVEKGCKVGLVARREGPLLELQKLIASKGGQAAIAVADVSHIPHARPARSRCRRSADYPCHRDLSAGN